MSSGILPLVFPLTGLAMLGLEVSPWGPTFVCMPNVWLPLPATHDYNDDDDLRGEPVDIINID